MALQEFKCTECEKKFKAGDWTCVTGENHKVAPKRYYMNDAPTVPAMIGGVMRVDKHAATLVLNIPPETRFAGHDGVQQVIPGGSAQFIRGMYETADPEKQFWLDKHKGMCTKAEWEAAYLNDDEKMYIERQELAAERSRLEAERNSLLEMTQQRQRA